MVGNDVDEDMCASRLGFNVYLIRDCMINRHGKNIDFYTKGKGCGVLFCGFFVFLHHYAGGTDHNKLAEPQDKGFAPAAAEICGAPQGGAFRGGGTA